MNNRVVTCFAFALALGALMCGCARQKETTAAAYTPECVEVDAKVEGEPFIVHCAELVVEGKIQKINTSYGPTKLDDSVTVAIHGLSRWAKTNPAAELRLYLAGHKLSSVAPTLIFPAQDYVNFKLRPTLSDKDERTKWIDIVNEVRTHPNGEVLLSVGLNSTTQPPFPSSVGLPLTVYPSYTRAVEVSLALLLIVLILLAWRTELIRDTTRGVPKRPLRAPISLGRAQMAWWFYLVIASYAYIWLITGETNTLNSSVLALIGISAATGLSAIFVDQQKISSEQTQLSQLQAERETLSCRIAALGSNPPPCSIEAAELQAKAARLIEVNTQLAKLQTAPAAPASRGILDILSDGAGVSLHRFQMVIWTLVLGMVFVRNVNRDLTMPEFDTTLLALMGLSAGTYVGFKFPETAKS
jgi:hypothetical protein